LAAAWARMALWSADNRFCTINDSEDQEAAQKSTRPVAAGGPRSLQRVHLKGGRSG
jgi:hypothetical protein